MNCTQAKAYLSKRITPNGAFEDLLRFPRYLEIETVHACNARCPMCTINDWQRDGGVMSDALFDRIAEEIVARADHIRRVSLYRDGEPLLDPQMPDRIARLKKGGIKEISLSTNVSLLNAKRSRALLQAGVDLMILSIDSLDKAIYESIRQGLNFDQVMENALRFIELRNQFNASTRIWVRMIRQATNFSQWHAYEAYWKQKLSAQDRVYYHNIFNWGGQLKAVKPVARSYEPNLPCVALWSLAVIFKDGDIPLCNVDYNKRYPLGNVHKNTIEALWRSDLLAYRRQQHLSGRKAQIAICQNCNVWDEPEDNAEKISSRYAEATELTL